MRRGRGPGDSPQRGGHEGAQLPGYHVAVYNQLDSNVLDQHRELDDMQSVDNDHREGVRKFLGDDLQFVIEQGVMKQDTEEF
jgi:hypothetical protein